MKKYKVRIKTEAIIMHVEAKDEEEAIEKAENEFYHEISRGIFEIDESDVLLED